MARIITIASQKGGVGKTTTALNLGFSLSRFGSRVLLIDGDPQGGMSIATNVRKRTDKGLIDIVRDGLPPQEIVMTTRDPLLAVAGIGQPTPPEIFMLEESAHHGVLQQAVRSVAAPFDYVIIDAPAGIGSLVNSWLCASDGVILVVMARLLSLKTLPSFLSLTQWVRERHNPALRLDGVLMTMINREHACESELLEEFRTSIPEEVAFRTMIPADEMFERASIKSLPVALLPGGQQAAKCYLDLAVELKERELLYQRGGMADEPVAGLF